MNLASWALVGGTAGIAAGIFFGDLCGILSPIGFAYVGLLQGGGVSVSDLLAAARSRTAGTAAERFDSARTRSTAHALECPLRR
jgi:hypothetical protein